MQTIVKTTQPYDLLALVPQLVGFRPHNSLVLVAFRGKRTGGAYRVDLPAPASETVYKRIATTLIGMLCKIQGADGVIPVIYTEDSFSECGGIPRESLMRRLLSRANTAGFVVKEALCVASDGWGSYFDEDGAGPSSLALIDDSDVHRALPEASRGRQLSPEQHATLPKAKREVKQETAAALAKCRENLKNCVLDEVQEFTEDGSMLLDGWSNPVGLAEVALSREASAISPTLTALLALAAQSPCVRDVLLFDWAWGATMGRSIYRTNLRHLQGQLITEEDEGALGLAGMGMPQPDPERIRAAIELLRVVSSRVPKKLKPPLLTMLAWFNWALGRGSAAGLLVDSAREINPRYGLADLLDDILERGILPEWVFERAEADPDATVVTVPGVNQAH